MVFKLVCVINQCFKAYLFLQWVSKEIALKVMPLIKFISSQGIRAVILPKSLRSHGTTEGLNTSYKMKKGEANHLTKS